MSLEDAVELGSLTVRVHYQSGTFVDIHGGCTSEMPNAIGTFGVNAQNARLNASFISLTGFEGPHVLATCQFEDADNDLTLEDLVVNVTQASDVENGPVDAPAVSVSLPDCDSQQATSTSTTTSTLELPERSCDVTFRLGGNHKIGALDWQVTYAGAPGEFAGIAGLVECDTLPPGTLSSYNNIVAQDKILAALINPTGFQSPANIATCRFIPDGDDPVASDFQATVKKATTVALGEVLPAPSMTVSKIECGTVGEDDCGNGDVEGGEECDDGNQDDDDGCSADCELESDCGDANRNGSVQASDSLRILQSAVGIEIACPLFVCDTDANGDILAGDSLRTLQSAVGQLVELVCPLP